MLESPEWISKAGSWFAMNAKEAGRRLQRQLLQLTIRCFCTDQQGGAIQDPWHPAAQLR